MCLLIINNAHLSLPESIKDRRFPLPHLTKPPQLNRCFTITNTTELTEHAAPRCLQQVEECDPTREWRVLLTWGWGGGGVNLDIPSLALLPRYNRSPICRFPSFLPFPPPFTPASAALKVCVCLLLCAFPIPSKWQARLFCPAAKGDSACDFSTADSATGATKPASPDLPSQPFLPSAPKPNAPTHCAREAKFPHFPPSSCIYLLGQGHTLHSGSSLAPFRVEGPPPSHTRLCRLCQPALAANGRKRGSFITSTMRTGLPAAAASPLPSLRLSQSFAEAEAASSTSPPARPPALEWSEAACHVGKWNVKGAAAAHGNCKRAASFGDESTTRLLVLSPRKSGQAGCATAWAVTSTGWMEKGLVCKLYMYKSSKSLQRKRKKSVGSFG